MIVKDEYDSLWFYRHSDGYPEGALPTLEKFMTWVKEGKIRDNVEQSSGWLVLLGAAEYAKYSPLIESLDDEPKDWKVGAYEPSVPEEHGDIEYLYTLDLNKLTIRIDPKRGDKDIYYADGWRPKVL